MNEKTIWSIHMAREHGSLPIDMGYVAIGWSEMGDFGSVPPTREAFKAAYVRA